MQNRLELLLVLACGPPAPVIASGDHHSLRKRRKHPVVVPEIKPPVLPPLFEDTREAGMYYSARPDLS
jgi:hypothetical protein